ncbi:unnamed protein product [Nippostrongylus brasiliensis]|uniref:Secreted protein n=1 Tax=Nippostrongylus brasiliensis TaxID=27835 RepID=A0A0N4YX21_NIPBR|nr:unnamed protein product [Nippostrongylus brasiliensis]
MATAGIFTIFTTVPARESFASFAGDHFPSSPHYGVCRVFEEHGLMGTDGEVVILCADEKMSLKSGSERRAAFGREPARSASAPPRKRWFHKSQYFSLFSTNTKSNFKLATCCNTKKYSN